MAARLRRWLAPPAAKRGRFCLLAKSEASSAESTRNVFVILFEAQNRGRGNPLIYYQMVVGPFVLLVAADGPLPDARGLPNVAVPRLPHHCGITERA